MKRTVGGLILILTFALAASSGSKAVADDATKPNVVVVMVDNLGWGELGVYGGGLKGDVSVDGRNGNAVSAKVNASAVQLLPMLKALADLSNVEGLGRVDLNVTGGGVINVTGTGFNSGINVARGGNSNGLIRVDGVGSEINILGPQGIVSVASDVGNAVGDGTGTFQIVNGGVVN